MTNQTVENNQPLDPASARMVAKVRWLMAIAGATTLIAVSAVTGVIGYRLFTSGGSRGSPVEAMALLPKGARIVATGVTEDRIAVTLDVNGATEIRTFDLKTLRATGRLRFATEP